MTVTLYCLDGSPPNRAVYLCLEALGLTKIVIKRPINLYKLEHLTSWYTKLNPQHTVPTLDDNGVVIWDSHAINMYLVSKYGKNDSLYPKDLRKRAIVDQRLHFDSGVLFPRLRDISETLIWMQIKEVTQEKIDRVMDAFDLLESFLEGQDYVAGEQFTIADFSCVTSVSSLVEAMRFSTKNHPRITEWLQRCRNNLPGYKEAQERGLQLMKRAVDIVLDSKL